MTDREPASFLQRAAAYAIDLVALGFIWFGSAVAAGVPGNRPEEGFDEPWDTIFEIIILALPAYWFVYHWVSNAIGFRVGKRIMSISIEPSMTAPAPILRGLVRTIGEVISALPFGLGYLWALWDPDNRTWHDRMAGTRVINERAAPLPPPAGIERERTSARLPAKNLRFACQPSSPAAGIRWVELRREAAASRTSMASAGSATRTLREQQRCPAATSKSVFRATTSLTGPPSRLSDSL